MPTVTLHASTVELEQAVRDLEVRLLAGDARQDEIDAYVRIQIELAQRDLARTDAASSEPTR